MRPGDIIRSIAIAALEGVAVGVPLGGIVAGSIALHFHRKYIGRPIVMVHHRA